VINIYLIAFKYQRGVSYRFYVNSIVLFFNSLFLKFTPQKLNSNAEIVEIDAAVKWTVVSD